MIQIEKPNMNIYICNCSGCFLDPVYYKIDNGFFIKTKYLNYYINSNGFKHREDGFATIQYPNYGNFFINGSYYDYDLFAKQTSHLICKNCNKFCKQQCL